MVHLLPNESWRGRPALGIAWQIGTSTGWGVYGMNLAVELLRGGDYFPLAFEMVEQTAFSPLQRMLLQPVLAQHERMKRQRAGQGAGKISCNFVVLRALGDQFGAPAWVENIEGTKNVGVIFFSNTEFRPESVALGKTYDAIVAGSTWNAEVLHGLGFNDVRMVLQGIDPTIFHPAPRGGWFRDRFVIFSGGKLEFRKGQDLVVAAFKRFHARHSESLLVTAWHNFWHEYLEGVPLAGHVSGRPDVDKQGRVQVGPWLLANGLPEGSFVDCGQILHDATGQLLRECDVALFPNRCEGGTNLVAMESMACGVPTILSANTGHLDIARPDICYPLLAQCPVSLNIPGWGMAGWGESDIDEIAEMLEQVYRDRDEARRRSERAVCFMQELTWEKQVAQFIHALADVLPSPKA